MQIWGELLGYGVGLSPPACGLRGGWTLLYFLQLFGKAVFFLKWPFFAINGSNITKVRRLAIERRFF
jgi:hypothetical protein